MCRSIIWYDYPFQDFSYVETSKSVQDSILLTLLLVEEILIQEALDALYISSNFLLEITFHFWFPFHPALVYHLGKKHID